MAGDLVQPLGDSQQRPWGFLLDVGWDGRGAGLFQPEEAEWDPISDPASPQAPRVSGEPSAAGYPCTDNPWAISKTKTFGFQNKFLYTQNLTNTLQTL